ncbi:hypothetical protein A0O28_0098310 [Trichoderma guizhouense]|uniref:HNH nuclease domain-containing protein n=1 Tax=Trichoderma guizhouense TaxID=1491466 RepID=A0A1T3CR53_9HYPO|nr:hypothetical protein A0O28_0098310 [Trichoderma guizhouense]
MFSREFEDPLAKHILTPYPSSSSSNQFAPISNINPAQWRTLQSDVDKILDEYSSSPVQNQDDTPKVLRAFLKYLCEEAKTLLMQEIKQFNGRTALKQLRNFLVDSILKTMLIAGGKQPKSLTPSPIVIPGLSAEESQNQLELRSDHTAAKQACLRRDNNRCIITGMIDDEYVRSLPPQRYGDLTSCTTECAHIIPFALSKFNQNSTQESEIKDEIWRAIYRYFPFAKGKISSENLNTPANAITLWTDAHEHFGAFRIAFEPMNRVNQYRIHNLTITSVVGRFLPTSIIFNQSERAVAMPDPDLLRLHYQVSMILQESGIRQRYERTMWESEDNLIHNIQSDGSTDLGNILSSKMLTDI